MSTYRRRLPDMAMAGRRWLMFEELAWHYLVQCHRPDRAGFGYGLCKTSRVGRA